MKNAIVLLVHLVAGLAILVGTGGARAVLAEDVLLKQQLLVLQRSRGRAPNLRTTDRRGWPFVRFGNTNLSVTANA
jgi:putative transposase